MSACHCTYKRAGSASWSALFHAWHVCLDAGRLLDAQQSAGFDVDLVLGVACLWTLLLEQRLGLKTFKHGPFIVSSWVELWNSRCFQRKPEGLKGVSAGGQPKPQCGNGCARFQHGGNQVR